MEEKASAVRPRGSVLEPATFRMTGESFALPEFFSVVVVVVWVCVCVCVFV